MIVHNGKTWRTLADKLYHGDRQIVAAYKGGVKYYPDGPLPPAYLTFYNPVGSFTLRVYTNRKFWDGVLEWSADAETWSEWDGTSISSSNDGYLFMRGTGNSVITGLYYNDNASWVFSGRFSDDRPLQCLGNIESILDHGLVESGIHPVMGDLCFSSLFELAGVLGTAPELPAPVLSNSCYDHMFAGTQITTAPELPATTLARGCYAHMFSDCRRLTTAPARLPATTLAELCYDTMFSGCTSLIATPEIMADTLAKGCCSHMFSGCASLSALPKLSAVRMQESCYMAMFSECTGIRLSTEMDGTYRYAYRIPTGGSGIDAYNPLGAMFRGTGGPFTGTPTLNTTYYTDHEPV